MIRRALFLPGFALVLCSGLAGAQQPVLPSIPQSLSLADAVDLATRNNPLYRQTLNDRGPASWGVRNAYADFLPSMSVSASGSYSGSGSQTFGGQNFTLSSATLGSSYSLGLNWNFSGSSLIQPGLRKAQLNAVEANSEGARVNLRSAVATQYLNVLQANAQVGLADVQLKRSEEFRRLAQARFDVGQATLLDVRRAEVESGQSEVGVLRAKNNVIVQKLRLFQQMGVPAPEDPTQVTLSDSFPIVDPTWALADLLRDAEAQNPDLLSLRANQSAARAGERSAKSAYFPSLSMSAGWSGFTQQYTNSDFLVNRASASAGANFQACNVQNQINTAVGISTLNCAIFQFTPVMGDSIRALNKAFPFDFTKQPFSARFTVSLPIFDQFSRPLQVSEASARADDAAESVRARGLFVRAEVTNAFYGLQTANQTVKIQDRNRTAAQEQLRLATERYRVGSGTFFELTDAQLAAQRAESDYINAVYDYHKAIAALEPAVGRPLR
ncbi:MAG: TolC family protein [Gemmatimonadetes bacterium]|nr:TolC family protein [Gemmatimonadota bacterium]